MKLRPISSFRSAYSRSPLPEPPASGGRCGAQRPASFTFCCSSRMSASAAASSPMSAPSLGETGSPMTARARSRFSSIAAMIADMREALEAVLGPISEPVLLPGGASKEAWAVDAGGERLLVRRAGGGVIPRHTLSLRDEFGVRQAAHEAGVKVPRPVAYIEDLDGREAFVMERLEGETIGRR